MYRFSRGIIRKWGILSLCLALLVTNLLSLMTASPSSGQTAAAAGEITSTTATTAPAAGQQVNVTWSDSIPMESPQQQQARQALLEHKRNLQAPPMGKVAEMPRQVNAGPPTDHLSGDAPSTFTIQRDSVIPSSAMIGGASTVDEPRSANSGKVVFQTGNWYAAQSTNQGATWSGLNPSTVFGDSHWCCDQDTVFVPSRNRFFWLELFYAGDHNADNHLAIANASSSNLSSWCYYNWFPTAFGLPSGTTQDFPKIAYSNNYLYITWNNFSDQTHWFSSTVFRISLDTQASCASLSGNYLTRTDNFGYGLSSGSQEAMYWASAWFTDGTTNGANLRLFKWPENSTSYTYYNRAINTFRFGNVACRSPDGLNWCSRLDPRYLAVWISRADYRNFGDDWIGVAISAGPSSFTTHNYVVYEYFTLHSLTYKGNDQTYSTSTDFAYPSAAPNARGAVGITMAWGGGAYYPGSIAVIQDDYSPVQPWNYSFYLTGQKGAGAWGDYTGTQPWWPNGYSWIATGWRVLSTGAVQVHNTVFGRGRDTNNYVYWNLK